LYACTGKLTGLLAEKISTGKALPRIAAGKPPDFE
jgi:hypothetical protein